MTQRPLKPAILGLIMVVVGSSLALADDDATSLSYISYLERYVTLHPASGDETIEAVVNMPVLGGDRLDTARGARAEVQLPEGATIWIDEFSTLDFDSIAFSREESASRTSLYVVSGSAAIEIPATAIGEGSVRVDSPAGSVFLNRTGLYRLELLQGQLRVQAFAGLAELPAGAGSVLLRGGQQAWVRDGQAAQNVALETVNDDFWRWVEARRSPAASSQTAHYVDTRAAPRAAILDSYGDWVYVDSFSSYMWRPHVSAMWSPYTNGRWYWTRVGWTWISYQPWGWYPFHYGSWYLDASVGWVWSWDWVWGPAWVHWIYTPGYVGWCPRGYYDYWYWNNHRTAWDWRRYPNRWGDVALNLHGRVHLREIDPRPWTFVPTRDFTSSRLSRVRVDSGRLLHSLPGNPTAIVRSGPLVTPSRDRGQIERTFDSVLRNDGGMPDVSGVLRRDVSARGSFTRALPEVASVTTRDLARVHIDRGDTPSRVLGSAPSTIPGHPNDPATTRDTRVQTRGTSSRTATPARPEPSTGGRDHTPPPPTSRAPRQVVRPATPSQPAQGSEVRPVTPSSPPSSGSGTTRPTTPSSRPSSGTTSRPPAPSSPPPSSPPPARSSTSPAPTHSERPTGERDRGALSRSSVRTRFDSTTAFAGVAAGTQATVRNTKTPSRSSLTTSRATTSFRATTRTRTRLTSQVPPRLSASPARTQPRAVTPTRTQGSTARSTPSRTARSTQSRSTPPSSSSRKPRKQR